MKYVFHCLLIAAFLLAAQVAYAQEEPVSAGASGAASEAAQQEGKELVKEGGGLFKTDAFAAAGVSLRYSLFTPKITQRSGKYPLVAYFGSGDVSVKNAASQPPYGAVVWTAKTTQEKNPCYVLLLPSSMKSQDSGFEKSPETDAVIALIEHLLKTLQIDPGRVYSTGAGAGGRLALNYDLAYPSIFAASLLVDCYGNSEEMAKLVEKDFILIGAESRPQFTQAASTVEAAARAAGRSYTTASWSAQLPLDTQDGVAQTMLEKGAPINIFSFEGNTDFPGKSGSQDFSELAYRLQPLREWLLQRKK